MRQQQASTKCDKNEQQELFKLRIAEKKIIKITKRPCLRRNWNIKPSLSGFDIDDNTKHKYDAGRIKHSREVAPTSFRAVEESCSAMFRGSLQVPHKTGRV